MISQIKIIGNGLDFNQIPIKKSKTENVQSDKKRKPKTTCKSAQ
jgi:hypothetical protein